MILFSEGLTLGWDLLWIWFYFNPSVLVVRCGVEINFMIFNRLARCNWLSFFMPIAASRRSQCSYLLFF